MPERSYHAVRTSEIMSGVREAMRSSPVHTIDDTIPPQFADLLAAIDEAERRHRAQVAAFRAGSIG